MKKIYIAHSKDIDYINELYEPLKNADFLKNYTLLLPHELSEISYNTRAFYKDIDIFIAEVSKPATGLGIELGWVFDDNTKIYPKKTIYKKKLSSFKKIAFSFYFYIKNLYVFFT